MTRKEKWEAQQLYWYIKWQKGEISHEKSRKWLKEENFKGENESFLMVVKTTS